MIDVNLDGTPPNKVSRIAPEISVDASGNITWVPAYTDYNADAYYRGKTVTNQEFNELLLKDVYQGNYITDTLVEIFNTHLGTSVERYFKSIYNLIPSYVKKINPTSWGELQEDGYYYITIPAEEHGFEITESDKNSGQTNIDIEMYLMDINGNFHEVMQYTIDEENTITLYGDDSTLTGFIVVRTNDKSYALAETHIDATQVTGLASVATSGNYTDLINRPDSAISDNTTNIAGLLSGTIKAAKAKVADSAVDADNVSSSIQNIPIENIFETGSSFVKNATNATNATNAINADNATHATNADMASQATNALAVNSIPLLKDDAGRIRVGIVLDGQPIIIPQRKILWSGDKTITPTGPDDKTFEYETLNLSLLSNSISDGDWIEIKFAYRNTSLSVANLTTAVKFKVRSTNNESILLETTHGNLTTSTDIYKIQFIIVNPKTVKLSTGYWFNSNGSHGKVSAQYFEIAKIIE